MPPSVGAPKKSKSSTSRKSKSSWRKAIDISDVTQAQEEKRAEERVTGSTAASKPDDQLFMIDTKGDDEVQRLKPPKKLLKSQQILAQRSQHPAVFSKPSSSAPPSKKHLTQEQKDRLRRIARKDVKGPFNAIIANDPTKWGDGSALFNGHEGGKEYDAWVAAGGAETQGEWDGPRTFIQKKVKTPKTLATMIRPEVPAVREPATGQSYNPTQEAHQALLQQAYDVEVARIAEEQRSRVIKDKMAAARKDEQERDGPSKELVYGMQVDLPKEGEDSDAEEGADREEGEAEGAEWKKSLKRPERKTRQQRLKAQKGAAKAAEQAAALKSKRLHQTINTLPTLRKSINREMTQREQTLAARELERQNRIKAGLAGVKVGKHVVGPGGEVDVQLGEELSESWRAIKPEGNLFKDRFTSMQHRALVEPRKPIAPKHRRGTIKQYEKHAWKRFE